jgi:hypothetical protein
MTCSFALYGPFQRARPCWVRDGVPVGVLEPVGEPLELVGEQMPVMEP